MMADWRKQFGAGLPFVIVQIPDYGPTPTQPVESLWSDVREAQRKTAEADAHAALVVTVDIGDPKVLHPTNKQEIGRRIAIAARHLVYGEAIAPSGPRVAAARRNGDQVTVSFRDVTGALTAYNGEPNAFELCDASDLPLGACHPGGRSCDPVGCGAGNAGALLLGRQSGLHSVGCLRPSGRAVRGAGAVKAFCGAAEADTAPCLFANAKTQRRTRHRRRKKVKL